MSSIPQIKQSKLELLVMGIVEFGLTYSGLSHVINWVETTKNKYFLWIADKAIFIGIGLIGLICSTILALFNFLNKLK